MKVLGFWHVVFNTMLANWDRANFAYFIFLFLSVAFTLLGIYGVLMRFFFHDMNHNILIGVKVSLIVFALPFTYFIFCSERGLGPAIEKAANYRVQVFDAIFAIGITLLYFTCLSGLIYWNKSFIFE
jgi:hypothetical protein